MTVKPWVFTGPMVLAIMAGRKTMSRRIMRVQPPEIRGKMFMDPRTWEAVGRTEQKDKVIRIKSPFIPGEIRYVAEGYEAVDYNSITTRIFWFYYSVDQMKSLRKATLTDAEWEKFINRKGNPFKKLAGRFMYHSLARIWPLIKGVKAEMLLDISEEDARKEGCSDELTGEYGEYMDSLFPCRTNFFRRWLSIHGNLDNKWVWAVEFERTEKPEED